MNEHLNNFLDKTEGKEVNTSNNNIKKELKKQGHSKEYDDLVPNEVFDIEDSDEMAEAWADMFGYC